jgi:hypothetical protein
MTMAPCPAVADFVVEWQLGTRAADAPRMGATSDGDAGRDERSRIVELATSLGFFAAPSV